MNETTIQANIADTIAQQLGGTGRLAIMIGAKYFVALENGLRFRIGRGAKHGINLITITLTTADVYDVDFGTVRGVNYTVKDKAVGVYAEQLREVIEFGTGLYLTLGTMGR